MRFVAQYPGLVIGVKRERRRLSMDGEMIVVEPGISAEFKDGWSQHDLEVALQSFQFKGLFQYEDEATPVSPTYRISVYDTDEEYEKSLESEDPWDAEKKSFVEQRLLSANSYGRSFVVVPEQVVEAPWPAYLEFVGDAEALVLFAHTAGFLFEDILEFETSKWGPRREDVIEALQTAISVRDEGKVVVE